MQSSNAELRLAFHAMRLECAAMRAPGWDVQRSTAAALRPAAAGMKRRACLLHRWMANEADHPFEFGHDILVAVEAARAIRATALRASSMSRSEATSSKAFRSNLS